ncbi:MAG TPA: N-acetyltransferase [Chromatiaceae bacterium]|jgi:ribosomal protein S18 acetylase RimI-like enzyme|nr:N-acetyltransferase [Chromatiaceae bacterium]HIA08021.1 N-acetyltransferase [Chromatiaceae bacterium]HIN81328.1 N-acetyltransferase [Chromatiales bacterium]HIO54685.1 N-acetyltransferase [Chromatiales bacterium]
MEACFELRWQLLRAPWGQPRGSERDAFDATALHRAATMDDDIIGVGRVQPENQTQWRIRYMAVVEAYRHQGVGAALLESLERVAREHGGAMMVLDARELALGFYQAFGYQKGVESKHLFGEIRHFHMTKEIDH